jgi:hypothetical protein
MRLRNFASAIALATALGAGRDGCAEISDAAVHAPNDYFSLHPPNAGSTYDDPVFGTSIRRLSDARHTRDDAGGGTLPWVFPEYSTPSIFNSDDSHFLLAHGSYFGIYGGDGRFQKNAPFEVSASTEPRWSRRSPNVFYYKLDNALKQYDVEANETRVVHTFGEYGRISGRGESDICFDGDHLVLVGDDHEVFVYEISSGRKGPVFDTAGHDFDSVYISANDDVTITWLAAGRDRFNGIELFDRDMHFLRQVARAGGHMDMGRDTNGQPVLIWANGGDPEPVCDNGVVKIRLSDAQQTCLLQIDESLAVHISASDEGWAVVSTYAPSDPRPDALWPAYTDEILRLRLDGSRVERLAHHRSRPSDDYNWEPKATISRDGNRIVYGSNFGLPMTDGYPAQYADAYLIRFDPPPDGGGCHGQPGAVARMSPDALAAQLAFGLAPVGAIVMVRRRLFRRGRRSLE